MSPFGFAARVPPTELADKHADARQKTIGATRLVVDSL